MLSGGGFQSVGQLAEWLLNPVHIAFVVGIGIGGIVFGIMDLFQRPRPPLDRNGGGRP